MRVARRKGEVRVGYEILVNVTNGEEKMRLNKCIFFLFCRIR
jgi:hypothetical protein